MSELSSQNMELSGEFVGVDSRVSPGGLMRGAREAAGVSIDALAAALKISVGRLEALESDRYIELPDMVFARALASSACRILNVDSSEVLALMPRIQTQSLPVSRHNINATFKDGSESHGRNSFLSQLMRPLGVAALVLLVGAGVLFFLPQQGDGAESVVMTPEKALDAAGVSQSLAVIQSTVLAEGLESVAAINAGSSAAVSASEMSSSDVVSFEATTVPDASIAGHEILKFHAREPTWVQVRDGNKAVVFERILAKGTSASVTGAPPLSVVIGRADSTDVFLRGAPFVLNAVAKDNVARFEVE